MAHFSKSFGKISAEEFFASVDENGDGEIDFEEFMLMMQRAAEKDVPDAVWMNIKSCPFSS